MSRTLAVVLLLITGVGESAPVPKSLKKPPSPDGTWRLTEFWSNGQKGSSQGMVQEWVLEGEAFYVGRKDESNYWQLTIPDPDKPHLRQFAHGKQTASPYPAVVEVDGDTLRFCYAISQQKTLTACVPDKDVYYYVFTRVRPDAAK